jgi:anti-anti-sigma regulatory factor
MENKQTAVELEQIGEIVVIKLPSEILTVEQCRLMLEQFQRLIADHHCDFILDFANVRYMSSAFLGPMLRLTKWAEARSLGRQYRPLLKPLGGVFTAFDDRDTALKEMARHDEHGWAVLCSVPPHIRELFKVV